MPRNDSTPKHEIDRLVSPREARKLLGVGRTTEFALRRTTGFPARLLIGVGRYGYRMSELQRWIASRPVAPPAPAPEHALAARRAKRAASAAA